MSGPDDVVRDSFLELGARLFEHHGVAALAWRDGAVTWANRPALDLVAPVETTPLADDDLLRLLDSAFDMPASAASLSPGGELAIDVELGANRALLRMSAIAIGLADEEGELVLVTFRAPLEANVDPAHVARLETMLESTSDIITVIDREGRIRFSNAAAGRITGVPGAEANGTEMVDFVHPEDTAAVVDVFTRGVLERLPVEPLDVRLRMEDGQWHHTEARLTGPVEIDGVEGWVVTIRDISDRVWREADNLENRRRLESIVQHIDDVIVILGPDFGVKWTSPGIDRLIDAPAYTNVGENAFNDMHPDDLDEVVRTLVEVSQRPDGRSHTSFRLHHARHGWRWLDAVVVNRLDDPAIEGLVCTMRDVTDERDRDTELRRLAEHDRQEAADLRQADEVKDRFLATVSHELRTPLASVRGFSGLLEAQWEDLDAETRADMLRRVSSNARTMENLIEQLLDFSRLQADAVEVEIGPLEVRAAIESMVDGLQHHLADHEVVIDVGDHVVLADQRAFDHVLRNLLTNAARYSMGGTAIELTADRDDDRVRIHVTDHGIGIAEEDQSRVFQSFFQSAPGSPAGRGTGIGLNIARRYAQLQSGHLHLESTLGEGSTFTFELPAADPTS